MNPRRPCRSLGSGGRPGPRRQASPSERAATGGERTSEIVLALADGLESLTNQIIEAALQAEGGSTIRAAAKLKVSARTLQRHVAAGRVRVPVLTRGRGKSGRTPRGA